MQRSTIIYTTGEPGSGKSYVRCVVFLLGEFLPGRRGRHWSNFPLGRVPADFRGTPPRRGGETFRRRIAEHAAGRMQTRSPITKLWRRIAYRGASKRWTTRALAERIRTIPEKQLARWRNEEGGPWEYFKGKLRAGDHVAIDECHHYIGRTCSKDWAAKWEEWLGEIRHIGITVEFLSQHHMKVGQQVSRHAGVRYHLQPAEEIPDPYFKIPLGDWYQLRASFITGCLDRCFGVVKMKQKAAANGGTGWTAVSSQAHRAAPWMYDFYNSYSKPTADTDATEMTEMEKEPYERFSRIGLLGWFYARHAWPITSRGTLAAIVIWLCFFGGGTTCINLLLDGMTGKGFMPGSEAVAAEVTTPTTPAAKPEADAKIIEVTDAVTGETVHVLDEPTPEELQRIEELERLEAEKLAVAARLDALLEMQRHASAIVLITQDTATFKGGYTYAIGERIDYGPHLGDSIKAINYGRRYITLESGVVLRMGRELERVPDAADVPAPEAGIPPDLPRTAGNPPAQAQK